MCGAIGHVNNKKIKARSKILFAVNSLPCLCVMILGFSCARLPRKARKISLTVVVLVVAKTLQLRGFFVLGRVEF